MNCLKRPCRCGGLWSPRVAAILFATLIAAPTLAENRLQADELTEKLAPLITAHEGDVAVAVRHLDSGVSFRHRADQPMPTASLIKFPVMIEAYRQAQAGLLDLKSSVTLRDEDKVPGSGILTTHFSAGASFSVRDAIRLMIAFSDNTATNLVVNRIGLPSTAKAMEDLGHPETKLHSLVYRRDTSIFPDRSLKFGLGSTTADDMLDLLQRLHQRELVSPEASDAMKDHLLACDDKLKFLRLLPTGTKVAHKTGSVDASRTDAGILYTPAGPIAVCVLTSGNKDQRWTEDNAGDLLCARLARAVYDVFNPPKQPEKKESNCGNDVDEEGPLSGGSGETASGEESVREQSEIALAGATANDTTLPPLQPRDPLTGLPFVACRNWVVADAKTGKLIGESGAETVVDVASTTKIMTAYVILHLVNQDPAILDEPVAMSERASRTSGSSCDLKQGERLPVREMLYAMLLPSGNDAAAALAEHFGRRFEPASRKASSDSLARFVAEMNRRAKQLEMSSTRYTNPHGLPEKGHASSAHDLVRVTVAARQFPLFREIVRTRRYETEVTTADHKRRPIAWKNTNRLLAISGYTGVKTGYTKAAGSCLVSTGERGRDSLIVVVLGSPSAASAAADSRNLYRWAWRERGQRE